MDSVRGEEEEDSTTVESMNKNEEIPRSEVMCPVCRQVHYSVFSLSRHLRAAHKSVCEVMHFLPNRISPPFSCTQCGTSFLNAFLVHKHYRIMNTYQRTCYGNLRLMHPDEYRTQLNALKDFNTKLYERLVNEQQSPIAISPPEINWKTERRCGVCRMVVSIKEIDSHMKSHTKIKGKKEKEELYTFGTPPSTHLIIQSSDSSQDKIIPLLQKTQSSQKSGTRLSLVVPIWKRRGNRAAPILLEKPLPKELVNSFFSSNIRPGVLKSNQKVKSGKKEWNKLRRCSSSIEESSYKETNLSCLHKSVECPACKTVCRTLFVLQRHIQLRHMNNENVSNLIFTCHGCGKYYKNVISIQEHMKESIVTITRSKHLSCVDDSMCILAKGREYLEDVKGEIKWTEREGREMMFIVPRVTEDEMPFPLSNTIKEVKVEVDTF